MKTISTLGLILLSCLLANSQHSIEVTKIWDQAPHNAFTDLCEFRGQLLVTFREGERHVHGADGKVRIIGSTDGVSWKSMALLKEDGIDLRDPKLAVMPDGRIMMTCGGSDYQDQQIRGWHTRVAFSSDGEHWSMIRPVVGIPRHNWFFRITWHNTIGYVAPSIHGEDPLTYTAIGNQRRMEIYQTLDGLNYSLVSQIPSSGAPCEGSVHFNTNNELLVLIRNEAGDRRGRIARSLPPYSEWSIQKTNIRFGGENMILLPDGRWIIATRSYAEDRTDNKTVTALFTLYQDGKLQHFLDLPSGGDTSYPGLLIKDNKLFVSYYSSHEGKTAIYLAKINLNLTGL